MCQLLLSRFLSEVTFIDLVTIFVLYKFKEEARGPHLICLCVWCHLLCDLYFYKTNCQHLKCETSHPDQGFQFPSAHWEKR